MGNKQSSTKKVTTKKAHSGKQASGDVHSRPASSGASSHSRSSQAQSSSEVEQPTPGATPHMAKKFRLKQLQEMTGGFSEKRCIGEGGFGKVYRGDLKQADGSTVAMAVKRLMLPEDGEARDNEDFFAEVLLLSRLAHPNLIVLQGYCMEGDNQLLVYELCSKGSLESRLFPKDKKQPMDWSFRVDVAIGTAHALAYLHENGIIHRDLKPNNILFGDDWTPKLIDFGLAKEKEGESHVTTRVMGTMGYLDPDYMESGMLREASDVYSFGVILLQLLTGREATGDEGKLTYVMESHLVPKVTDPSQWMDPLLRGKFSKKGVLQLATMARHCIDPTVGRRPSMMDLSRMLEKVART